MRGVRVPDSVVARRLRRARDRAAAGEIVLAFLVRYRDEEAPEAGEIGRRVFAADGRAVAAVLRRLEDAGLVRAVGRFWHPTGRGREVDAILDRITAARGGAFQGRYAAGITTTETLALG